eukprot:107960-Prymnesium_polylepis.1
MSSSASGSRYDGISGCASFVLRSSVAAAACSCSTTSLRCAFESASCSARSSDSSCSAFRCRIAACRRSSSSCALIDFCALLSVCFRSILSMSWGRSRWKSGCFQVDGDAL